MTLKINKASDLSSISVLPPHARISSGVANSGTGRGQLKLPQLRSQGSQHGLFSQFSQFSQCTPDIIDSESIIGSQERELSVKRISCPPPVKYSRQDTQKQSKSPTNLIRRWQAPEQKCQKCEEINNKIGMVETTVSRMGMIFDSIQGDIMQVKQGEKEVVLELESIRQKLIFHDDTLQLVNKGLEDIKSTVDECFKVVSGQENARSQAVFQEINAVLAALPHKLEFHVHKVILKEIQAIAWTLKASNQCSATPIIQPSQGITDHSASLQNICPRKPMPPKAQRAALFVKNEKGVSEKVHRAPLVLKEGISIHAKVPEAPLVPKNDMGGWKSVKRNKAKPNQKGAMPNQLEKENKLLIELDEDIDEGFSCLLLEKERDFHFGSNTGTYTAEDEKSEIESILRRARRRKRKHSKPIIIECDRILCKDKPWLTYSRRRKILSD